MLVCHTYKKLIPFRLAIHVMTQIEQCGLQKQWTWEPMMGESLILALVDNNDVRLLTLSYPSLHLTGYLLLFFTVLIIGCAASWESHFGTCIPSTGFDFWLQFLCSSASSLSAIFLGLRYAVQLVKFHTSLRVRHLSSLSFVGT